MSRYGTELWNNPISNGYGSTGGAGGAGATQRVNSTQMNNVDQYSSNSYPEEGFPQSEYNEEPVDYDIYNRAISVSSPRLAGVEGETNPGIVRKKVVRRVEVPFTRQVKVPTQTVQIVPTTVETKVPVKKLVQVPGFKTVDETYTEYEEREAIREKEIWVKKIVPEKYIERVPVQRVRQVQKPTTLIKEIESYETVQVPSTKKVLVDGYRIDEVQDSKVVEVEEVQDFQLAPQPVGEPVIHSTRDLGRLPNSRLARNTGPQVYQPNHPSLRDVDADSEAGTVPPYGSTGNPSRGPLGASGAAIMGTQPNGAPYNSTGRYGAPGYPGAGTGTGAGAGAPYGSNQNPNSFYRPSSPNSRNLNIQATNQLSATQSDYGRPQLGGNYHNQSNVLPAGSYKKPATSGVDGAGGGPSNDTLFRQLGLGVDETHTRHTDGTGVLVSRVDRGGAAARAGLQPHDIITSVQGRPTNTVDEFAQLIGGYPGPVTLTVNRDGRRNLTLAFVK